MICMQNLCVSILFYILSCSLYINTNTFTVFPPEHTVLEAPLAVNNSTQSTSSAFQMKSRWKILGNRNIGECNGYETWQNYALAYKQDYR